MNHFYSFFLFVWLKYVLHLNSHHQKGNRIWAPGGLCCRWRCHALLVLKLYLSICLLCSGFWEKWNFLELSWNILLYICFLCSCFRIKWNFPWATFFLIVFSLHRIWWAGESPREAEGNATFCWSLRSISICISIVVEACSKSLSFSDSPDCCIYCAFYAVTPYSATWNHIFGFNYRSMSGIKEISLNLFKITSSLKSSY